MPSFSEFRIGVESKVTQASEWMKGVDMRRKHLRHEAVFCRMINRRGALQPVSVPFRVGGGDSVGRPMIYQAVNDFRYFEYEPGYPAILIEVLDPLPGIRGDESVEMTLRNVKGIKDGMNCQWRMGVTGKQVSWLGRASGESGDFEMISKDQNEVTAVDVAQMFVQFVAENTRNQVVVERRDVIEALGMLSGHEALKEHWERWKRRAQFQRYLVEHRGAVLFVIRNTLVASDSEGLSDLEDKISSGDISGWAEFVRAIGALGDVKMRISAAPGHHVVNRVLTSHAMMGSEGDTDIEFPASVILDSVGVGYFNALIEGWIKEVSTRQLQIAAEKVETQKALMESHLQMQKLQTKAAKEFLRRLMIKQPQLLKEARAQGDEAVERLVEAYKQIQVVLPAVNDDRRLKAGGEDE